MFKTFYSIDTTSEVKAKTIEHLNLAHHYFAIVAWSQ